MNVKYKLKVYPITENGKEIYCGGFYDVISINFASKIVTTLSEYSNHLILLSDSMFGKRELDEWNLKTDIDGRDKQSELYISINGGKYILVDFI